MKLKWKIWWVRALRGGKFTQGRLRLRDTNNRCCPLGVLADGLDPTKWRLRGYHYKHDGCWGSLSTAMAEKAGVSDAQQIAIMRLNDKRRLSFPEIADWIELNL